jgi:hypothetical protein
LFLLPGIVADGSSIAFLGRNWGYHFLSYFPLPFIGLAYAVFAASLVPSVQTLAISAVSNVGARLRSVGSFPVYIAISLLSTIALWWLRQKYPFLGGGHIRSSELDSGIVHTSGRTFIQFLLYVSTTFQLTGRETYQVVNTLLGVPFVYLVLLVSHEIGTNALSRVLSEILIGCSGIIQYYAGYMEVYAPLPILMLLPI